MKKPGNGNYQYSKIVQRWMDEDYPGGAVRFQLALLVKDAVVFILVPIVAIVLYKIAESSLSGPGRSKVANRSDAKFDKNEKQSQIIHFIPAGGGKPSFAKRSPGTLVRVRLQNVVETSGGSPVHAQIIDAGLGQEFLGGTMIGDATPEPGSSRIKIEFRFVRHPKRMDIAAQISARAISLDGVLGVTATKKEGFFARAAIRSASGNSSPLDSGSEKQDLKTVIARTIAAGFMQEFQSEATVAQNQAQVLTLQPLTEFFVELTDFFPGQAK
jgi:hypothetical protein